MNRTDPDAIWYYQGWILGGEFSYIKGLTSAVKQGHIVISDMYRSLIVLSRGNQ